GGGEDLVLADMKRNAKLVLNALGHAHGVGEVIDFKEDREFVAAEPRDRVGGAQRAAQPFADADEEHVAERVAEAVVDDFEAIEIDEEDRELMTAAAARALHHTFEPVHEQGAVR